MRGSIGVVWAYTWLGISRVQDKDNLITAALKITQAKAPGLRIWP